MNLLLFYSFAYERLTQGFNRINASADVVLEAVEKLYVPLYRLEDVILETGIYSP